MSTPFVIGMDPAEMAVRFADESEPLDEDDRVELESPKEWVLDLARERLDRLLDQLPAREADLIELVVLGGMRQEQAGELFGVTQAAVSYRIGRAFQRLKWMVSVGYDEVSEADLRPDLVELFDRLDRCLLCDGTTSCHQCWGTGWFLIDLEILVAMYRTSSQSQSAVMLGITQGRLAHRLKKLLARLEAAGPEYARYAKLFGGMRRHWGVLVEMQLPQWSGRDPLFDVR